MDGSADKAIELVSQMARRKTHTGVFEPFVAFEDREIPHYSMDKGNTSSRGRVIKKSAKVEDSGIESHLLTSCMLLTGLGLRCCSRFKQRVEAHVANLVSCHALL